MNEKICRLCLQTISENYQTIEESLNSTLKLKMYVSKEAVKCIECANNLEVLFNFQSSSVYMRNMSTNLEDNIHSNPENIEITNSLISFMECESDIRCSFCSKTSAGKELISLNESKEHLFLVNVLREHIPKLNLITEELLTCEACLDRLQGVLSFVIRCMDVEERIRKYIEMNGADVKGQIELKDVQQFIFEPTVKFEDESRSVNEFEGSSDELQDGCTMPHEPKMKYEMDNPESFIKTDENVIKSEQNDYDGALESSSSSTIKKVYNTTMLKCDMCSYETNNKQDLDKHELTHKGTYTKLKIYKCELCQYEAYRKDYLTTHKLIHKSTSEVTMFKCDLCAYMAKHKHNLKRHKLTHKSTSELIMYKCDLCPYETKFNDDLKKHILVHKTSSDVTMFKCDLCSYKAKHKNYLTKHKLTHKSASEVPMYKCDLCSYETKHKQNLKQHKRTHKSAL